jgi:hypothetical protein
MADKEAPEPIKKYYKISDKAKRLADTMEFHHSDAYNAAAFKHLKGEDGLINMDLLKDDKKQVAMAEDMSKYYVGKAKEFFKSKIDGKDEIENAMLTSAYANITQGQLRQLFNREKERLTLNRFNEIKDELVKPIRNKLKEVAMGHLTRSHIDDIVKYTGADKVVNPGALDINNAATLLDVYKEQEAIPGKGLERLGFEDHQLKAYSKKKK